MIEQFGHIDVVLDGATPAPAGAGLGQGVAEQRRRDAAREGDGRQRRKHRDHLRRRQIILRREAQVPRPEEEATVGLVPAAFLAVLLGKSIRLTDFLRSPFQ